MTDLKLLFKNVTLGNIILNNRIGVAPMARTSATSEGVATNQMVSYYTSFARGGFGFWYFIISIPTKKLSRLLMSR
ncbi:hypothetical protein ABE322_25125 [Priestia megaterium]